MAGEQGGFRFGRKCLDQGFVLNNLIEKFKENKLYMIFMDLEKAYGRVYRKELWRVLDERGMKNT